MSEAACSGSDGGDDKKWKEKVLDKLVDQPPTSGEEYDDEDVDKMNISSAEEMAVADDTGARSKKRGNSPHYIGKSKSYKKLQTDWAINKSKEVAKKEQPALNKKRRKKIAKERRKSLSAAGASGSHSDQPMIEAKESGGYEDDDTGGMADDSRTEDDESESDGLA